jgi:Mrp family chromosome partitioning ATPase
MRSQVAEAGRPNRSVADAIRFLEAQDVRMAGITSDSAGNDCGELALAVAQTYASFGRRTLFLDASHDLPVPRDIGERLSPGTPPVDLQSIAQQNNGVYMVSLSDSEAMQHGNRAQMKAAIDAASRNFDRIVVQLPPVIKGPGRTVGPDLSFGASCDSVLLVCRTGVTTREYLKECLQVCSIWGVKIGGLIMDDRKLPFARLLRGAKS